MFELATRLKLRFATSKGYLSAEDLWDLSLQDLNQIAKSLNKEIKSFDEDDFLEETTKENQIIKLQFDIVLYILKTKKEEKENAKQNILKKAEKEKILSIIEKKQDKSLENLSEEDLKKKLEDLN